ncbi:hypothetical protein LTR64_001204 [Lithohypha guttulata]|uniref:uncharacterized protein n=1 Tax=Lithohypha guttulata TaxID=1690604 RepID=UPI002DDE3615|nr:hypothetical protein LTR51_003398 [Lithohypha guttulata]
MDDRSSKGTLRRNDGSLDKVHPSELLEFATVADSGRIETAPTFGSATNHATKERLDRGDVRRESVTRSNDDLFRGMSVAIPDLRRLSADARAHTEAEHKMTFVQGCRLYPKAIAWSVLLSATIIMEGFDLTLISSFQAFPIFRRTYGEPADPNGRNHQISPAWQTGLQNGAIAGEIIGLFLNGWITDRLGYQRTMLVTLVWMCLFVFLAFFAFNIELLMASQVLCGIPWGIFQTLSMTYAAEIMPIALRAYLLANVNMCWLIGQITAVGILRGFITLPTQWSYRIPFSLQWAFAVPILIGVLFAPDSPWWLVRHGRYDAAKKAMLRLTSRNAGQQFNVDEAISMLRHTNEVEKYLNTESMTYLDCFKGVNLRRTEIACMVWAAQALCGLSLTGWAAYYYEQAGFAVDNAFNLSIGMYGLGIIGGMLAWALLPRVGRRRLYLVGLIVMQLILIASGTIGATLVGKRGSWAVGTLLIVLTGIYDVTVGPVCYVLVAEIPSTRLRVKTVVLARVAYNLLSLVTNILTARMLNPTAWNWAGKANFVYAGTNLICLIWCYFRLPETMGLSYLELDILFEKKAKTKKFREFQVNLANTGYFSLTRPERSGSVWRGY